MMMRFAVSLGVCAAVLSAPVVTRAAVAPAATAVAASEKAEKTAQKESPWLVIPKFTHQIRSRVRNPLR